jgi:hypothetical protein
MMNKVRNIIFIGLFIPLSVFAAGSAEGAASLTRGSYLSELGYIIQPEEIRIDSYISLIDYNYPSPDVTASEKTGKNQRIHRIK